MIDPTFRNINRLLVLSIKNKDYTKGNLLDYSYHQNYCKPIRIDLSRHKIKTITQQF